MELQTKYHNSHQYTDRTDNRKLDMNWAFLEHIYRFYQISECELNNFIIALKQSDRYDNIQHTLIDRLYLKNIYWNIYDNVLRHRWVINTCNNKRVLEDATLSYNTVLYDWTYTDLLFIRWKNMI